MSPTNSVSFYLAKFLASSLNTANSVDIIFGVENDTLNCATMSFQYVGDNSADNYMTIGMKGDGYTAFKILGNGNLYFTNDVVSTLQVYPTNTTSFYIMKLLSASLADGNLVEFVLGKTNDAKNCSTFAHYHSSDGADANYLQIGIKSHETAIKVLGDGKIEFNTAQITHDAGTSLAMNYISSDTASAISIISAGVDSGVKQTATLILRSVGLTTSTATIEFNGSAERLTINNIDGETWIGGDDAVQIKCKTDEVDCACTKFFCADKRYAVEYASSYTYIYNPNGTNGAASSAGCLENYHDNGSTHIFSTTYSTTVGNHDHQYNGTVKQRLQANGTCSSTGSWLDNQTISDDRLKEKETPLSNCLETILKLRPQIYEKYSLTGLSPENPLLPNEFIPFTDRISTEFTIQSGLIAQEVYSSCPELSHIVILPEDSDLEKIKNTEISEDPMIDPSYTGWGIKTPANVLTVQLIPYLIGAIQEQQKQISQQQVIIDKLLSSTSFKEFKN